MNTSNLLQLLLLLHLVGLVVMAGITVADMIAWRYFWKVFAIDRPKSAVLAGAMRNSAKILALAAILLILSGIGMLAVVHGVFAEELWFRIKMGVVLLLVINGAVIARPILIKMQKLIAGDLQNNDVQHQVVSLKGRLNLFYNSQIFLFLVIILLSVFKFN